MSQQEKQFHSGVTGRMGGSSDNRETYIRQLVSQRTNHLTSFLYLCSHLLVYFKNLSSDESIIFILEHTLSKCVKLLEHLSDLHEPLINQISSGTSSGTSTRLDSNCFICVCVHGFPVCIPSFCKRGETQKSKHWLLRKLLQKKNLC